MKLILRRKKGLPQKEAVKEEGCSVTRRWVTSVLHCCYKQDKSLLASGSPREMERNEKTLPASFLRLSQPAGLLGWKPVCAFGT